MHTVTFYSYKGGVGRTLVVANVAKYLARLRMNVFVLDFDLEAPGIHYKFGEYGKALKVERGLVDILSAFAITGRLPEQLTDYVIEAPPLGSSAGKIHLLPAGNAPSSEYWKKLSKVNWHTLFYSEEPDGIPLFLELKAFIEDTYAPDFLLIDSRTGITEMGGVATTVLSDQVVCMMLPSHEHLEGTREVMHAIRGARRVEGATAIELVAVLSRLPHTKSAEEASEVERVKDFLNSPVDELGSSLSIKEVAVLHREPALESREQILVGSDRNLEQSLLLQDYVRLFTKLVPPGEIEQSIGQVIEDIKKQVLDSPDQAEETIEALAKDCLHPEAYRALLSIYRLRRSPPLKRLEAAYVFWKMTGDATEPLLWDAIKDHAFDHFDNEPSQDRIEAVDAIWRARGLEDSRLALALVRSYEYLDSRTQAIDVLVANGSLTGTPSADAVARLVALLNQDGQEDRANQIIGRFKERLASASAFLEEWATSALAAGSYDAMRALVDDPHFRIEVLEETKSAVAARVRLFESGDQAAAKEFLRNARIQFKSLSEVVQLAALARDLGDLETFKVRLVKLRPNSAAIFEKLQGVPSLPETPPLDYGPAPEDDPFS